MERRPCSALSPLVDRVMVEDSCRVTASPSFATASDTAGSGSCGIPRASGSKAIERSEGIPPSRCFAPDLW